MGMAAILLRNRQCRSIAILLGLAAILLWIASRSISMASQNIMFHPSSLSYYFPTTTNKTHDNKNLYLSFSIADQMQRRDCMRQVNDWIRSQQVMSLRQKHPVLIALTVGIPDRSHYYWKQQRETSPSSTIRVLPPQYYQAFFSILALKPNQQSFFVNTRQVHWTCHYYPINNKNQKKRHVVTAELLGRPPGGDPCGSVLVVQCPKQSRMDLERLQMHYPGILPGVHQLKIPRFRNRTIAWTNLTWAANCFEHVQEDEYETRRQYYEWESAQKSSHGKPLIAASTQIWGQEWEHNYPNLAQWVAWNKVIGIDHVFVYLKEPWRPETMSKLLPSAPWITYRHWDIDNIPTTFLNTKNSVSLKAFKTYLQGVQQTHALYTARQWGGYREEGDINIEWMAMMDNDEFFAPFPTADCPILFQENYSMAACHLKQFQTGMQQGQFAAVEVATQSFGSHVNPAIRNDPNDLGAWTNWSYRGGANETLLLSQLKQSKPRARLDYTWKSKFVRSWWIPKTFASPMNTIYYCIHLVSDGAPFEFSSILANDTRPNSNSLSPPHGPEAIRQAMHRTVPPNEFLSVHFRQPENGVGAGNEKLLDGDLVRETRLKEWFLVPWLKVLSQELKY